MTESVKKLNFDSLDFSKITAEQPKIEIQADPIEGIWIDGQPNTEITAEMFQDWIEKVLPGCSSWEKNKVGFFKDYDLSVGKDRERVVVRISTFFHNLFGFPPNSSVKPKKYKN